MDMMCVTELQHEHSGRCRRAPAAHGAALSPVLHSHSCAPAAQEFFDMPPESEAFRPSFEQGTTTNPLFHPGARARPRTCRGAV